MGQEVGATMSRPTIPKSKSTLYFRGIARDLKDKFKGACYRRGETMQDVIERFMREYVEADSKPLRMREGRPRKNREDT